MKTCEAHGKKIYPSSGAAISAALRYSRKRGTPLRYYYQPGCGFHLTSKKKWSEAAERLSGTYLKGSFVPLWRNTEDGAA